MEKQVILPGINIQWPISKMILSGHKTVETRTYRIPEKYLKTTLAFIETPGPHGDFRARIVGLLLFDKAAEYSNEDAFYADSTRHCVTRSSPWKWDNKQKWGWTIGSLRVFAMPMAAPNRRGIRFTAQVTIPESTYRSARPLLSRFVSQNS
jgi:hypothetical protein